MALTRMDGVTLAVLAGGESSRMGTPKAELTIDRRPILAWLLNRCAWPGPTLLVTAPRREHPPGHELFAREVADPVARAGPVRGILTALEDATTPTVIVSTVDMPGVGNAQLQWLLRALDERDDLDLLMPSRLISGKVQPEPFPLVCRLAARPTIAAQLKNSSQASAQSLAKLPRSSLILAPR